MAPRIPINARPHISDPILIELAQSLVLRNPNLNILRPEFAGEHPALVHSLEQQLKKYDSAKKLLLPNLSVMGNESISIFSDYSGEGSGHYYTYSFLVCAWNAVDVFQEEVRSMRRDYGLGSKEIAFKDLRMGQMKRSLPKYLSLLDNYVPGLLFTLIVDKQLLSLFGPSQRASLISLAKILQDEGFGHRAAADAEKLLRIVHTAAFLTGLLGKAGQKVFWMTDHDTICANETLHQKSLNLFGRVVELYSRERFALIGGAAPFRDKNTDFLDLLSASDLAAGSIAQYMTNCNVFGSEAAVVKEGGDKVLQWLGHDGLSLKKFNMIMKPGRGGMIDTATIEFIPREIPPDVSFVPIAI